MLKVIAIVVVLGIALVLILASSKPDTFRVERSTRIQAPPQKIFALVDDFHRWSSWSPYEKLDPSMKRTLSGAQEGKGAVYQWQGNAKAGEGRMEILESAAPSKIVIQLDFSKPFEAHNTAEFTFVPSGDSTDVTWAMHGPQLFVGKVMSLFMSMDKLVGKDFEAGLENLKAIAEK